MSGLQILAYNTEQAKETDEAEFEQQLCIELPEGMLLDDVVIENDYVKQLITIQIPGAASDYFVEHPLLGRSNNINDLYMANGRIEITMDAVYEPECTVEDGHLYLDFIRPQDIYDKVVVIDAGHGGGAPGAIKQGIMEKDINLAIVKELKELLDGTERNIGVYYTRTEDVNPSFEQRAQLAGKADAIRNSEVPVALIEVGFMTNQEELDKLTSAEYQKKAAQGIYNAILRALDEGY